MNEPRTAVLAGASGLTGSHCLELLLKSDRYHRVIALSRNPLSRRHLKLETRIVDFAALPKLGLEPGAYFFCALGTTIGKAGSRPAFRKVDVEYPTALAHCARQEAAAVFCLVSSAGADPASSNFYLKTKGEAEEAVSAAGLRATHIFRPGILAGDRKEFRLGERIGLAAAWIAQWAMVGGLRRYRPVRASDVATAMAASAWADVDGTWIHEYDDIVQLAAAWGG